MLKILNALIVIALIPLGTGIHELVVYPDLGSSIERQPLLQGKGLNSRKQTIVVDIYAPRVYAIKKYYKTYVPNSPLKKHARLIAEESEKNNIDYKWIVGIGQMEGGSGTAGGFRASHNTWGYDRYNFKHDNWSDAIKEYTRRFASGYGKADNLVQVRKYYCPPCNDHWNNTVQDISDKLTMYEKEYDKK